MARRRTTLPDYAVRVDDDAEVSGALRFTFTVQNGEQPPAKRRPPASYVVSVQGHGEATEFNWVEPPPQETTLREFEETARQRATARYQWLEKLRKLVAAVKAWAEELDWATRVIDKNLEDPEIGDHKAPALLLQKETVRLFLEPVARTVPGAEGAVDLYLMPYYDDIAGLYYYNNRWNVHYAFPGTPVVAKSAEAQSKPLTKATLRRVFDEMKAHAG